MSKDKLTFGTSEEEFLRSKFESIKQAYEYALEEAHKWELIAAERHKEMVEAEEQYNNFCFEKRTGWKLGAKLKDRTK